jgi:anti-sigma regulatory factor (Ser/Thr protein kinase)
LPERRLGSDHGRAMEHRATFELIPEAASQARAVVNDELGPSVSGKVLEDATLLVSELITNAVRHAPRIGTPQVELRLKVEPQRVRVVVSDPGGGFDASPRLPTASESSGWGLYLVDRIADRWGVISKDHSEVWFEIDVDG